MLVAHQSCGPGARVTTSRPAPDPALSETGDREIYLTVEIAGGETVVMRINPNYNDGLVAHLFAAKVNELAGGRHDEDAPQPASASTTLP